LIKKNLLIFFWFKKVEENFEYFNFQSNAVLGKDKKKNHKKRTYRSDAATAAGEKTENKKEEDGSIYVNSIS
jgi:hypothetical protein